MSKCARCGMEMGGYAVCPPHSTETYCSEACAACREHAAWHPVPGAAAPPDGPADLVKEAGDGV